MEGEAAYRLAERLFKEGRAVDCIIGDKDGIGFKKKPRLKKLFTSGSIVKAFRHFFPNVKSIHCLSHMMKNFLGLLYTADQKLGPRNHSMSRE